MEKKFRVRCGSENKVCVRIVEGNSEGNVFRKLRLLLRLCVADIKVHCERKGDTCTSYTHEMKERSNGVGLYLLGLMCHKELLRDWRQRERRLKQ